MLRGAIDNVLPHRIGGWIYSGLGPVAQQTVLAFVDGVCVGSGRVDRMREDLKRAGLGDGLLGFSFPIKVADEADLGRIVVKLEGSDLALLQRDAKVARRSSCPSLLADPPRIEWLRQKGLISAPELTFLKCLQKMGVVDHSLVAPRKPGEPSPEIADARAVARSLFELLALRQVEMRRIELPFDPGADIAAAVRKAGGAPLSAAAIHAEAPGVISVIEGSHVVAVKAGSLDGAIDYQFGPDRLLFLDLNARFSLQDGKAARLSLFVAF